MSSHHIVRDDQEPALIIANGMECSFELMNQLMEWSPFVLVLDGAIKRVLEMNIKFDAWLGDFDSGDDIDLETYPHLSHVEKIHAPDQELTDLQKGIQYLIQKGFPAANILWATGLRQDHHFNNVFTLSQFSGQITLGLLDDYSRVFVLPKTFKKWYLKDTKLSILPVGSASGIVTKNLQYNLENEDLVLPFRTGSSNKVADDGFIEISYLEGHLLLMECWD
jgi:thiamine pyrophosphokinase